MAKSFQHGTANRKPVWISDWQEIQKTMAARLAEREIDERLEYRALIEKWEKIEEWPAISEQIYGLENEYRKLYRKNPPMNYLIERIKIVISHREDELMDDGTVTTEDGGVNPFPAKPTGNDELDDIPY